MTAPVVSVTVPTMVEAPVVCAEAVEIASKTRTKITMSLFFMPNPFHCGNHGSHWADRYRVICKAYWSLSRNSRGYLTLQTFQPEISILDFHRRPHMHLHPDQ